MKTRLLILILSCCFLASCNKDENQETTNNPIDQSIRGYNHSISDNTIKLTNQAIFVKNDINSKLISANSTEIKFNYSSQFDTINNGDILYSLPVNQFKDGYSVKLSNKNIAGNIVTYSVTQPKIEEIFKEFHFKNNFNPNFNSDDFRIFVPNTSNLQNRFFTQTSGFQILDPSRIINKNISGNTMYLEYIFWDYDNNYTTTWDQVIAKMSISANSNVLEADFYGLLSILNPKSFILKGKPRFTVEITLEYNFDANLDKTLAENARNQYNLDVVNKRIPIAQISLTGNAPSDIIIKPTLIPYIKIGLSASTKFSFKTKYENFGANYILSSNDITNNNNWIRDFTPVTGVASYDFNTNINAHFDLGFGLGFEDQLFTNITSLFGDSYRASIGNYFEFNGGIDMNFISGFNNSGLYCQTFSAVPNVKVDLYSEGKITVFGNTLLDLPKQYIWQDNLLQGLLPKNLDICNQIPSLIDNLNYNYKVVKLNNRWWSGENWREELFYSSGGHTNLYYNSDKLFGVYTNTTMPNNLPANWRLPTKQEYEDLITSLGSNAFYTLTQNSSLGFNAKPYGYYYECCSTSGTFNNNNELAVFLTSTTDNPYNVWCLVLNYTNQTVSIQSMLKTNPTTFFYTGSLYNVRLIKE